MELTSLSIKELSKKLHNKDISVLDVTKSYLDNIAKKDSEINAFITVTREKAIEDARQAQIQINEGTSSTLTGIPMAVKDNMCTKGILTTCASKILSNFIPPYTATVVSKLYESGAVLLGKLNMDEFAMGSSCESSYFGPVKNPRDTTRVPGGSSGGSAAAVTADEACFTLGSDTGGSIRQPASFCGVVGLKSTYGTVSRYGLVAFASSLDQIGPICKTVEDCALVFDVIKGKDPMDSTSSSRKQDNCSEGIDSGVKGMKIAIPRQYLMGGIDSDVKASVLKAIKAYENMGAICEEIDIGLSEYAIAAYYIVSSAEASSNLARYDGIKYGFRAEDAVDLSDLYRKTRSEGFGAEVKRRIMLGTYALSSGYYDAYYKKALQTRTLIKNEFDRIFDKYNLILGPSAPTPAYKLGEKTDNPLEMYLGDIYTVAVNIAGLPAISIPYENTANGLPIGLQLIGKAFDEKTILRGGYALENDKRTTKVQDGV